MADIYNIPTDFLFEEGFPVVRDYNSLNNLFDKTLDETNDWMHIPQVDGIEVDEKFTPSEVLYKLARDSYDVCFQQWSIWYKPLKDGGYLHQDYEQSAADCWSIEMEKKSSKWKEKSRG